MSAVGAIHPPKQWNHYKLFQVKQQMDTWRSSSWVQEKKWKVERERERGKRLTCILRNLMSSSLLIPFTSLENKTRVSPVPQAIIWWKWRQEEDNKGGQGSRATLYSVKSNHSKARKEEWEREREMSWEFSQQRFMPGFECWLPQPWPFVSISQVVCRLQHQPWPRAIHVHHSSTLVHLYFFLSSPDLR